MSKFYEIPTIVSCIDDPSSSDNTDDDRNDRRALKNQSINNINRYYNGRVAKTDRFILDSDEEIEINQYQLSSPSLSPLVTSSIPMLDSITKSYISTIDADTTAGGDTTITTAATVATNSKTNDYTTYLDVHTDNAIDNNLNESTTVVHENTNDRNKCNLSYVNKLNIGELLKRSTSTTANRKVKRIKLNNGTSITRIPISTTAATVTPPSSSSARGTTTTTVAAVASKSIKRNKKLIKNHHLTLSYNKSQKLNKTIYTDAEKMIRHACENIHNIKDIHQMEWSEAVLLSIADISIMNKFKDLMWKQVVDICTNFGWNLHVGLTIRTYISKVETLYNLIVVKNRQYKRQMLLNSDPTMRSFDEDLMFYTRPTIDGSLLSEYIRNFTKFTPYQRISDV